MAAQEFNKFPDIIKALQAGAKVAVRTVAKEVTQEAAQTCPYDTGFLAGSHYYVTSDASTYGQGVRRATRQADRDVLPEVSAPESESEAIVAVAASYALPVHDGTKRMAGRPWLAQAANGSRDKVLKATGDALTAAIKNALG